MGMSSITELLPTSVTSINLPPVMNGGRVRPPNTPRPLCRSCNSKPSMGEPEPEFEGLCWGCWEDAQAIRYAETEAKRIETELESQVTEDLRHVCGLASRECKADWQKVPEAIKRAMPRATLLALSGGNVPATGFGLGADTGSGKTMALAAILRGFQRAYRKAYAVRLVEETRRHGKRADVRFEHQAVWLSWPDSVTAIRLHAIDGIAEQMLERAETAPLLVLDDLGRERIKGAYVDDFAASQLDRLVNHRYREELPTLWTSNLPEIDLTSIYGAALVSRLTEDAPLIWLDKLPSMRLK